MAWIIFQVVIAVYTSSILVIVIMTMVSSVIKTRRFSGKNMHMRQNSRWMILHPLHYGKPCAYCDVTASHYDRVFHDYLCSDHLEEAEIAELDVEFNLEKLILCKRSFTTTGRRFVGLRIMGGSRTFETPEVCSSVFGRLLHRISLYFVALQILADERGEWRTPRIKPSYHEE